MKSRGTAGFTLIELMVAVSILALLVAIVSTIFHQSSVAWNSGTQRMEANVTARAVLNFMSDELQHAVASEHFRIWVDTTDPLVAEAGTPQISFWTLLTPSSPSNRIARHVRYEMGEGDEDDAIIRKEWMLQPNSDYLRAISNLVGSPSGGDYIYKEFAIARNVEEVLFYGWPSAASGSGGFGSETSLPRAVHMRLVLTREDDISNVEAWSRGPDGQTNPNNPDDPVNEDNIGSW